MAFCSMPQGYILMKLWLKIFLSKFSLTYSNFGVYYLPLSFINNNFQQIVDYFLLESSEIDWKND